MKSLSSGGMTRRTACGRTTKRSAWQRDEAERPRGRLLARVDRVDAGPVDLGHVRRVDERQRDDAPRRTRRSGTPGIRSAGMPEAEDEDDQQAGDGPEHVHVDRREQADREEHRPRQAAQHRQHEAEHEDQDLGDQEQPDVDPELADQLGQRRPEDLGVEERLLERAASRAS